MNSEDRLKHCRLIGSNLAEAQAQLEKFKQITSGIDIYLQKLFAHQPEENFNHLVQLVLPLLASMERFFIQLQSGCLATVEESYALPTDPNMKKFFYIEQNRSNQNILKTNISIEHYREVIHNHTQWFSNEEEVILTLLLSLTLFILTYITFSPIRINNSNTTV